MGSQSAGKGMEKRSCHDSGMGISIAVVHVSPSL